MKIQPSTLTLTGCAPFGSWKSLGSKTQSKQLRGAMPAECDEESEGSDFSEYDSQDGEEESEAVAAIDSP